LSCLLLTYLAGSPHVLDTIDLTDTLTLTNNLIDEELTRSRTQTTRDNIIQPRQGLLLSAENLDCLKRRHTFLNEYSNDLLTSTPIDYLIQLETTSIKLKNLEKSKDVEDKLTHNRDMLIETEYKVKEGIDNRWNKLHEARYLPGAGCSSKAMWKRGREVLGNNKHAAIATYDMHSIGLAGHVTMKGWAELHDPGSTNLQLKLFSINNCGKKISIKNNMLLEDDLVDIAELGEFKTALRTLREAMAFCNPWNKSISAIEGFFMQNNFCSADLDGVDKQAVLLTQFVDYVLRENANKWKGQEDFLTTGDLKATWEAFFGARPQAMLAKAKRGQNAHQFNSYQKQYNRQQFGQQHQPQQYQNNQQQQNKNSGGVGGLNVVPAMYFEDICVNFNMGRCLKSQGNCTTKKGRALRHVCNFRPDMSQPAIYCGANHAACHFH